MEMKDGRMRNGAQGREASGTRVIGIGGAGWHMLRALAPRSVEGISRVEMNTDIRAVEALDGVARYQIGTKVTRGLGSGGDPEIGARAAEESAGEIGEAVSDCAAAVLMMGLGGGTATGAAPAVAAEARRRGARVVALCALPFEFEGRRRKEQARIGLEALRGACDAVFAFENDVLLGALAEDAGVEEAFGLCAEMLARMAVGLHRALACRGIMDLDPADLARVLGSKGCRVGWGDGSGEQRLNDALDRLMDGPMLKDLERGKFADVVAQVTGGPEMSLSDVQKVTKRIRAGLGEDVSVTLGALVDQAMRGRIEILMCAAEASSLPTISAAPMDREAECPSAGSSRARPQRNGTSRVPHVKAVRQMASPSLPPPPGSAVHESIGHIEDLAAVDRGEGAMIPEDRSLDPDEAEAMAEVAVEPSDDAMADAVGCEALAAEAEVGDAEEGDGALFRVEDAGDEGEDVRFCESNARANGMVQSAFNFETPSRGRFDKTEVTMYKGENLDIPTFMRRRMRITAVE